jgi:hypothetical protein
VGLFDWLFGRQHLRAPAVGLDPMMEAVAEAVGGQEEGGAELALLRARLGDLCRDVGMAPAEPALLMSLCEDLDEAGLGRLAVVVAALREVEELGEALEALCGAGAGDALVERCADIALLATAPLTLELISQSPLRVEEFARHVLARLGARVDGERVDESQARLERLDYGMLLAEAARAQESAEGRLEYLRKLQEDMEARFRPRGKW